MIGTSRSTAVPVSWENLMQQKKLNINNFALDNVVQRVWG